MDHPTRVGKYELEKFLGGGMSHVYRAKDSVLGRRVAVKILTEAGMADVEAKARFLQEARMASNIRHENIISIYDFGEDEGRPFMVMEFLEGENLRDAIRNQRTGDVSNRLRLAAQIARALDFIHSRKIIHRDVKPENIHVDAAGHIKLMDFGIAKSDGQRITKVGMTLGTPYYMAPEQVLGRPLTAHADIYAFGVMLYELLTGKKPLTGESVDQIFHKILYDPLDLTPLDTPEVPVAVRELIARCTAKQLIQRPQSLAEVGNELDRILEPLPADAPRYPPPPPGMLSPSSQRPLEERRLPMPPPPPETPKPAAANALPSFLQSEFFIAVAVAVAIMAVAIAVAVLLS